MMVSEKRSEKFQFYTLFLYGNPRVQRLPLGDFRNTWSGNLKTVLSGVFV